MISSSNIQSISRFVEKIFWITFIDVLLLKTNKLCLRKLPY